MALYGTHPSLKLAEDPTDPVWRWFILNGPHGERFRWERFGDLPRDIEYLQQFIDERTISDPDFPERARQIALKALQSVNTILVRTAIQVLTVLGTDHDMNIVREYVVSENTDIAKEAKCSLFERGIKIKRKN
jgi:hypothetical protein